MILLLQHKTGCSKDPYNPATYRCVTKHPIVFQCSSKKEGEPFLPRKSTTGNIKFCRRKKIFHNLNIRIFCVQDFAKWSHSSSGPLGPTSSQSNGAPSQAWKRTIKRNQVHRTENWRGRRGRFQQHSNRLEQGNTSGKKYYRNTAPSYDRGYSKRGRYTNRGTVKRRRQNTSSRQRSDHLTQNFEGGHIAYMEDLEEEHNSVKEPRASQQEDFSPASQQEDFSPASQQADFSPASQQADFSPASQQEDFSPASQQEDFSPASQQADFSPASHQADFSPASQQAYFNPVSQQADFSRVFQPSDPDPGLAAEDKYQQFLRLGERDEDYGNQIYYDRPQEKGDFTSEEAHSSPGEHQRRDSETSHGSDALTFDEFHRFQFQEAAV